MIDPLFLEYINEPNIDLKILPFLPKNNFGFKHFVLTEKFIIPKESTAMLYLRLNLLGYTHVVIPITLRMYYNQHLAKIYKIQIYSLLVPHPFEYSTTIKGGLKSYFENNVSIDDVKNDQFFNTDPI